MKISNFKKEILFGNRKYTVYSIGWLAFLVHRTTWTVRWWERNGILPKPLLSLGNTTRWYLPDEIVGYAKIYRRANVTAGTAIEKTSFKKEAQQFRATLAKLLNNSSAELQLKIPNDETIAKALGEKRHNRFLSEVNKLTEVDINV